MLVPLGLSVKLGLAFWAKRIRSGKTLTWSNLKRVSKMLQEQQDVSSLLLLSYLLRTHNRARALTHTQIMDESRFKSHS